MTVEIPDKLYFRIGEVSELIGVEPHVLRYWEQEFRIRTHRSQSGQRLYRKQDVGRFLRIRQLLHEEGYTLAGARKVLADMSAGGHPPEEAARPAAGAERPMVSQERVEEVLRKLQELRQRVATLRSDLGA